METLASAPLLCVDIKKPPDGRDTLKVIRTNNIQRMGVPKLWHFVSQTKLGQNKSFPYRADLTSTNSLHDQLPLDDSAHLIFDGPSFAYWYWREAGIKQGSYLHKTPLHFPYVVQWIDAIDQYCRFSEGVTDFIQRLLKNGNFKLTFIFDGGLPQRKRDERARRYQSLLNDHFLQSTKKSTKYITPPFVVLVCQQTLARLSQIHKFNVRVAPGEADDFCVRLARGQDNTYIVSVDGDFLVYVGETGNFIPLQTFPIRWDVNLPLTVYSKVRQGLGISRPNGMVEVAALLLETELTVPQCIKYVNQQDTLDFISKEKLCGYIAAYMATEELPTTPNSQEYFDSGNVSGRITELLCGVDTPTHWLPLLPISNPPRKDPWIISRSIRQSAYSELQKRGLLRGGNVVEMVRRGQRIIEDVLPIADEKLEISMSREGVFVAAMRILMENVSNDDLKYLPVFAGMFAHLGRSTFASSSAVMPPSLQYVALQYQSLIYSLIILLQCQFPTSPSIPEFTTCWDLSHFKTALNTTSEGRDIWMQVTEGMQLNIQNLWDMRNTRSINNHAKIKYKQPETDIVTTEASFDAGNPFSILSATYKHAP